MIKKRRNTTRTIEQFEFYSKDIFDKFKEARSQWVSEEYLYLINNKIAAFMFMMKEDLRCGFLHYHIKDDQKEYFLQKYPPINKKTNQVLFIYTEKRFRKKGIATRLLKFMINDLSHRGYRYIWLKKETGSQLYENLGFVTFLEAIYSMDIDSETFLQDLKRRCGCEENCLINCYSDIRLVKIL